MSDPLSFESVTPRFALPLLFAGQAQKEFFVNEALLRTDLLLHCVVEGEMASPPAAPQPGQAWLVAASPSGAFAGHAQAIAAFTEGGWRFLAPRPGMRVFDRAQGAFRLYADGWRAAAAVVPPAGGTVIDTQARDALTQVLERLVDAGIIPAS